MMTTASLMALSAALICQPAANPAIPTLRELIARTPIVDSSTGKWRSVEVSGRVNLPGEVDLRYRAVYREPGHFALLVSDGSDGSPLLYTADRRMLIYDPVGPTIYRSASIRFGMTMGPVKDKADSYVLAFDASLGEGPGKLLCDIRPLLEMVASEMSEAEEVVPTGGSTHRMTRRGKESGKAVLDVDLASPCPFTRIALFEEDDKPPVIAIERIAVDRDVKDDEFAFPDEKRMAGLIAVKELPADNLLANLGGLAAVIRAAAVRIAVNQPKLREGLDLPDFLAIDWDRVRANDAKHAAAMRDLIPIAARAGLSPAAPKAGSEDLSKPRSLREGPSPSAPARP